MSDDARFDPRFDPAFQPGYEGALVTRTGGAGGTTSAPKPIGTPPSAVVHREAPTAPPVEAEAEDAAPLYRNPFVIALTVIAAALIGFGLYLVSNLRDMYVDAQSDQFDFITIQVLMALAPLVLMLGMATAITVFVLFAVHWRSR